MLREGVFPFETLLLSSAIQPPVGLRAGDILPPAGAQNRDLQSVMQGCDDGASWEGIRRSFTSPSD